jgi:DNA-binding NarL/FixJ family response regulator
MPITVFLADDHAVMRDGLARLLESQADFKIIGAANNGGDTVKQVLQLKPRVVIMDISMPDMNGIEAARQIRERAPDTRVLILSMHCTPLHVFHSLEAGVRGYILKESAGSDVIDAVRTVHSGRRFLSPKVMEIVAEQVTRRPGTSALDRLSRRERETLQLVAEGRSSAQIASTLHVSHGTVDTYRSRLMQKLQIKNIAGLVKFAIQHGVTSLE